jgi:hypothetical protein
MDAGEAGELTEAVEVRDALEPSAAAETEVRLRPAESAVPAPLAAPAPEPSSFVYALGQIEPRYPSLAVEKEMAQAMGAQDLAGLTDRQALKRTLADRANRYLARSLCWVLSIHGMETYILLLRDPTDLDLLIDAYREEPSAGDLDVVIGVRKGIAPPQLCNGLALPLVAVDQLYSFGREALLDAIPRPTGLAKRDEGRFRAVAGGLLDAVGQVADNAGAIDEHRALNYLTVRYPRMYAVSAEQVDRNFSFTGVEVLPSHLSGARSIVEVVFSYTHRATGVVEKHFARVDVSEQFPFLVTPLSPYVGR